MKHFFMFVLIATSFSTFSNSALPNNRHISVVGSAKLSAKPDIAVIYLDVESTKNKSVDAKKEVDNRVNRFLDGIDQFKISEDNVSASNIATQANYSYSSKQKILNGYTAKRNLKVTLNELKHLNAFMDFALSVQLNEIRNIELKSSKATELKDQVNALAVENAKEKGQSLANAFGANLGKIYSINSTSNNSRHRYGSNRDIETANMRMSKPSSPGRYLQENIVFSASISVVFDLEI